MANRGVREEQFIMWRTVLVILAALLLVDCHHQRPSVEPANDVKARPLSPDSTRAGLCFHSINDPLIRLVRVVDGQNNRPVPEVVLSHFKIGDYALPAVDPLALAPLASRIQAEDHHALRCAVPCAFAVDPGHYHFLVRAPGYVPQWVDLAANYKKWVYGCPSSSAGSTEFSLVLQPKETR